VSDGPASEPPPEDPPSHGRARGDLWRAWFHPGAGVGWVLVLLGLLLDLLAIPPGPAPVLILLADVPFLLLLSGAAGGRWVRWVLLYGALHFGVAIRWVTEVHVLQVLGVAAILAPVYLFAAVAIRGLVRRGVPWLLAVPAILVGEEWLRTWWLGGMPWPARSLSFAGSETLVASASVLGAYGLSFLAGLANATLAGLPRAVRGRLAGRAVPVGPIARGAAATAALSGFLFVAGCRHLDGWFEGGAAGRVLSTEPAVLVSVQGNIPQGLKYSPDADAPQRIFDAHLDLSREAIREVRASGRDVLAVLWPETMVPWPFLGPDLPGRFPEVWENEVRVLQSVARSAGERAGRPPFLLGAIHHFRRGGERHAWLTLYGTSDSLFLVDPDAVPPADRPPPPPPDAAATPPWILGRHDKRVLVPGGEYTPLGDLLPPLRAFRDLVSEIPELDPGAARQPLFTLASLPSPAGGGRVPVRAGTVICFELAFPARCRAWRRQGADVLLNAANYGWFGESGFRTQIRAVASLRAAETGCTVVMAGNTGPTLFFDPVGRPYGALRDRTGTGGAAPPGSDETTFREGWTAGPLWVDRRLTPYLRWGDLPWALLALLIAVLVVRRRPRPRSPPRAEIV
jgi:apolipoprotein N-acyltransferase